jgi:hypothetical protein
MSGSVITISCWYQSCNSVLVRNHTNIWRKKTVFVFNICPAYLLPEASEEIPLKKRHCTSISTDPDPGGQIITGSGRIRILLYIFVSIKKNKS